MIKIHKEFIPYELSLKLKQVGFQEECMGYYTCSLTSVKHKTDGYSGPFGWKEGELSFNKEFFINNHKGFDHSNENWLYCGAPLYQQVFRWFRENGFDSEISLYNVNNSEAKLLGIKKGDKYVISINGEEYPELEHMTFYETYEEAEHALIEEIINILAS